MKKSVTALSFLSVFAASAAFASPYFVDSMDCVGKIKGNYSQVHPSYTYIVTKFTSFKSKRKSGGYGYSLRIANDYAAVKSKLAKDPGGEVWYMANLTISGDHVTHPNGEYDFTVTNVRGSQQTLSGRYKSGNSVAGNGYWYDMNCVANVVREPTRISDLTAGSN
jgi:hypothetical protein